MAGEASARPTSKMLSACVIHVCVHGELTVVSVSHGLLALEPEKSNCKETKIEGFEDQEKIRVYI
jgi:hypothetical protein